MTATSILRTFLLVFTNTSLITTSAQKKILNLVCTTHKDALQRYKQGVPENNKNTAWLGQAQITIFFITILRHFFNDFTAFFYDFVTMLREHSLPYRPMFSLIFKPKNWQ